jgi:hypothetical protein
MSHHYSGPEFGSPHDDARLDFTDLFAFPKPGDKNASVLIMDVHPSVNVKPPGPTRTDPFSPDAVYEIRIDTNGDDVADIAYRFRFSQMEDGKQTATWRRAEGAAAAGMGDDGTVIVENAPVSTGREAQITKAGNCRFFAGWRSDPFFFDVEGALNNLRFTGKDYFIDKNICSIVLELPNSELGPGPVRLWARTLDGRTGKWVQADRGARAQQTPFLIENLDTSAPAHGVAADRVASHQRASFAQAPTRSFVCNGWIVQRLDLRCAQPVTFGMPVTRIRY